MKQLAALIIFCISHSLTHAQTDSIIVWNKWCLKKDSMLLFAEGNNTIQVYIPGRKPSEFKVRSLDKALRIGKPEVKGDTLAMLAMPFPAKGEKMRLAVLDAKTSKQLKVVSFNYDTIPDPIAMIGKLNGTEAKRKDILSQNRINIIFPGCLYSYPYSIKGYVFKISHDKGAATIPVKGFLIPMDIIKEISAAPDGTVAEFVNIMATCPDCAARPLENIKLKIK